MADTHPARKKEQVEPLLPGYQDALDRAAAEGLRLYEQVFDDAPPGVGAHEIDPEKVLRRVNRGSLALLGYDLEELLGRPVVQFIVMTESSGRAIDKKLTGLVELRPFVRTFVRKDGGSITLLLLDRHLKDVTGRIVGIRSVYAPVEL